MPRLTVTISEEHERILERKSDTGESYRSKSEVIRECIEAHERVEELSDQLACLEAEVDMLRQQRADLEAKAARVDELETKLRQVQLAYHEAINEGKSPDELEPIVESKLDDGTQSQSTETLIEEAESPSVSGSTDSTQSTTVETVESEAVETEPAPTAPSSTEAVTEAEVTAGGGSAAEAESTPVPDTGPKTETPATAAKPASNEADGSQTGTEAKTDGGVEIDEELLYQSPGIGSRLKSALFGGSGSR